MQTMLLTAMGLEQDEAPPFASTMIFELWHSPKGTHSVKLLIDDVEIDLNRDYCGANGDTGSEKAC